jgi:hypothetical protein
MTEKIYQTIDRSVPQYPKTTASGDRTVAPSYLGQKFRPKRIFSNAALEIRPTFAPLSTPTNQTVAWDPGPRTSTRACSRL